jgi:hypothetical protein
VSNDHRLILPMGVGGRRSGLAGTRRPDRDTRDAEHGESGQGEHAQSIAHHQ